MLVRIRQEALLTLSGAKAQKFLQGQSTCDVVGTKQGRVRYGACCTPKGRAVCVFMLICPPGPYVAQHCAGNPDNNEQGSLLLLRMPSDVTSIAQNFLARYAVFDKVSVEADNEKWCGFGIVGSDGLSKANELWEGIPEEIGAYRYREEALVVRRDRERLECWCPQSHGDALYRALSERLPEANSALWTLHEIRAGFATVRSKTVEKFLPQMLNLESWDGISYTKGCYTGQEVVARAHHLGTLKRHLVHAKGVGLLPQAGDTLHNAERAPCGDVVSAAPCEAHPNNAGAAYELLAVVNERSMTDDFYVHCEHRGDDEHATGVTDAALTMIRHFNAGA